MRDEPVKFLVGDNPFHGISHLSQERARERVDLKNPSDVEQAAKLVKLSMQNGADGFMFSVSGTTLSILKSLREDEERVEPSIYAIVPYAYEYVRLAAQIGGVSALARRITKQVITSANLKAAAFGLYGLVNDFDFSSFLKAYVLHEFSRIKSAAGRNAHIKSILLHEIVTEMALALNMDWLFRSYIKFMSGLGIKPGFETRNFAYLVSKFREWDIDFGKVAIATPFNKVGFQMNPSKEACEESLQIAVGSEIIAMSVLAAGYLRPPEAIDYLRDLPNISGVVIGVSKEHHAQETFRLLRRTLA
jgi:hypothetical protein